MPGFRHEGTTAAPETDAPFSHGGLDGEFDNMLMLSEAGYYFYWTHAADAVSGDPIVQMALRCSVQTCLGWMGVGFSATGAMVGSHAIIGVPAIDDSAPATVKEYLLGGKYTSAVAPLADQRLTAASHHAADGFRTMRFARPKTTAVYTINDGADTTQTLIYAFGGGAPLQFHRGMGSVGWPGAASSSPTPAPASAPAASDPTTAVDPGCHRQDADGGHWWPCYCSLADAVAAEFPSCHTHTFPGDTTTYYMPNGVFANQGHGLGFNGEVLLQ